MECRRTSLTRRQPCSVSSLSSARWRRTRSSRNMTYSESGKETTIAYWRTRPHVTRKRARLKPINVDSEQHRGRLWVRSSIDSWLDKTYAGTCSVRSTLLCSLKCVLDGPECSAFRFDDSSGQCEVASAAEAAGSTLVASQGIAVYFVRNQAGSSRPRTHRVKTKSCTARYCTFFQPRELPS